MRDLIDEKYCLSIDFVLRRGGRGYDAAGPVAARRREHWNRAGQGGRHVLTPFAVGAGPDVGQVLMQNLHGQAACAGLPDLVAPDTIGGVLVLINASTTSFRSLT